MDQFEFFFTFYGLVLGLAAAEILSGLGGIVRERKILHIGPQTALTAIVLMVMICITWIDAWTTLRDVDIRAGALAASLGIAGCYYLCAVIIFPKDVAEWTSFDSYFAQRKTYVALLMLVAEMLVTTIFWDTGAAILAERPLEFWRWTVPYTTVIYALLITFVFVRGRGPTIAVLLAMLCVYALPYWGPRWGPFFAGL